MIVTLISKAIRMAAVYIFGCTGDIITEKSGSLNMGIPGIIFFGAYGGILGESIYANNVPATEALNPFLIIFIPICFTLLFAGIGGFIYAFFTVTLRCNQNVTGLTLTTLGVGLSQLLIKMLPTGVGTRVSEAGLMIQHLFPIGDNPNAFVEMFCSGSFFTYLAPILAIIVSIFIAKTRIGLHLRACGENPGAADAAGINVSKYRYFAAIIGAAIAGLGGLTYELDVIMGAFAPTNPVDSFGWLALSLVILSVWKCWISIFVSFAIGFLYILPAALSLSNELTQILNAVPYLATIVVLIITSIVSAKKSQGPAGLGQTYFREER